MGKTLYLECSSGISGDMTAAALLDLGADRAALQRALNSLPVDGFSVCISRVKKSGLDVCDFAVRLSPEYENHDHDMEYLYGGIPTLNRQSDGGGQGHAGESAHIHGGDHDSDHAEGEGHACSCGNTRDAVCEPFHEHERDHDDDCGHIHDHHHEDEHGHGHEHEHDHDHEHTHEHDHAHEHKHEDDHACGHDHNHEHEHDHDHEHTHDHGHVHRGMPEIRQILAAATMTERARGIALRIFEILAQAEAKAHGVDPEHVHFHEVGAVDSIVDIVSVAVCLDSLDVTDTIVTSLTEGCGHVRCQHGVIPVPVPAVLNIAQAYRLPLHMTDRQGELVTPTGAAIVAAIRTRGQLPSQYVIGRIGIGAGKRAYERPSLLRAMLLEEAEETESGSVGEEICKLETDIDDCTGEALGYAMERLFEAGALDVHYLPAYMKKNRPAVRLEVLCAPRDAQRMERILFEETTTIGIRRQLMRRSVLQRSMETVRTSLGEVRIKVCTIGEKQRSYPEYESVRELALRNGLSYQETLRRILCELVQGGA